MKNIEELEYEELREFLFKEFGVSGIYAKRAYELAWEYGHSSGNTQVRSYFIDLVTLLEK